MALNSSGPISLAGSVSGQSIALELSLSASGEISLNQTNVRALAGKSTGAVVMPTDFWGKSALTPAYGGGATSSPFVQVYQWSNTTGFGTKYSDPATTPLANSNSNLTFNSSKNALMIGASTTTYAPQVYGWSSSGYGTKYSSPSVLAVGTLRWVEFANSDSVVMSVGNGAPYINAWAWSNSTGFGTKYSNPASTPNGNTYTLSFGPSDAAFVSGWTSNSPWLGAWPWNPSSGFGTRYSQPASGIPGSCYSTSMNPARNTVVMTHTGSPYVTAYPWSNSTGFGTKYAQPATLMNGQGASIHFNPATGASVVVGQTGTPYINAYAWSGGWGSKYSAPATVISNYNGATFSNEGTAVVSNGPNVSPYLIGYPWTDAGGFGAAYAAPSSPLPGSLCRGGFLS